MLDQEHALTLLSHEWGQTVEGMLEAATWDSVAASICLTPGCGYTTDMEPDQSAGWCEWCGRGTVVSCLVLAGLI